MKFSRIRFLAPAAFALALAGSASAGSVAPVKACEVAKAIHVESVIGKVGAFHDMLNVDKNGMHSSLCAYGSADDTQHYGLWIATATTDTPLTIAHQMQIETHKIHRHHPDAKITHPKIGQAAVWDPVGHRLTVWVKDGKLAVHSLGDPNTGDLEKHLAIVRKVLKKIG